MEHRQGQEIMKKEVMSGVATCFEGNASFSDQEVDSNGNCAYTLWVIQLLCEVSLVVPRCMAHKV